MQFGQFNRRECINLLGGAAGSSVQSDKHQTSSRKKAKTRTRFARASFERLDCRLLDGERLR